MQNQEKDNQNEEEYINLIESRHFNMEEIDTQ